ncbi:MAG: hypothetical protein JOZ94_05920 [Xanthobacteraceae bacterium]|nr:hypothetical protein [Xanthobacteraceae bacterium]MBV9629805.1 hypothetical protein [Xanthobacteraceae bacterium]
MRRLDPARVGEDAALRLWRPQKNTRDRPQDRLHEGNLHAELGQIVAGRRPGREQDAETILLWHRGLSITDIALGHAIWTKANKLGIGQTLPFA